MTMGGNYPPGTGPGDPAAPWNEPDPARGGWDIDIDLTVAAIETGTTDDGLAYLRIYGEDQQTARIFLDDARRQSLIDALTSATIAADTSPDTEGGHGEADPDD